MDVTSFAPDACPSTWPGPHAGAPGAASDGNVSVLVGGNLVATGAAGGAEGVVVVHGHATFALDNPGAYEVGATSNGSQVTPFADSDMLTVGGAVAAAPGTTLEVGRGLGGDVVVGDVVAQGSAMDLHGGQLDTGFPSAVAPYDALLGALAAKSTGYTALNATGTVSINGTMLELSGDGVSDPQVFTVDGSILGAVGGTGRTLQVLGVPAGASVIVNMTGPAVSLDVDSLVDDNDLVRDPATDPAFADLATRMLWNAPDAASVDVGGQGQLPGSILVPNPAATTTLSGAGTNGRILVAGDLVHGGSGRINSYPFLADPELGCGPELAHVGVLMLDVGLQDPDRVAPSDQLFQGDFSCDLDGVDVTPAAHTWQARATSGPRELSDQIPVGAVCTVTEQLDPPAADDLEWLDPTFEPDAVRVAKRDPRGIVVLNRALARTSPTPFTVAPEPTTSQATPKPPPPPTETDPPVPSSLPDPTNRPEPTEASSPPDPEPVATGGPPADGSAPSADGRRPETDAGPVTTAPYSLRGTFVWGPLLLLSLLTLLVRFRHRPKRQH